MYTRVSLNVSIKLYLQKQAGGQIWPSDYSLLDFPGGSVVKKPPAADTADRGSIPGQEDPLE